MHQLKKKLCHEVDFYSRNDRYEWEKMDVDTDEDKYVNTELIPTFVKELKIYETVNSEKLSLLT